MTTWRTQILAAMREAIQSHEPNDDLGPVEEVWCRGCVDRWPCPDRVYAERIVAALHRRTESTGDRP